MELELTVNPSNEPPGNALRAQTQHSEVPTKFAKGDSLTSLVGKWVFAPEKQNVRLHPGTHSGSSRMLVAIILLYYILIHSITLCHHYVAFYRGGAMEPALLRLPILLFRLRRMFLERVDTLPPQLTSTYRTKTRPHS